MSIVEELGIHTTRDAALFVIDLLNLFLSQQIQVNDTTVSIIEECIKNHKIENIINPAYLENNTVDLEVCCSDRKRCTDKKANDAEKLVK